MRFNSIPRTSTFAWSPSSLSLSLPLIATGTVAGALDENFSNDALLEIWSPFDKASESVGKVISNSKFNRLAWGNPSHGKGLIAAGMESGELAVYDPEKILAGEESIIFQNTQHNGPVRGVDFNKVRKNLLVSGAVNGEVS
ncbi:hypothetical protein BT69DRAFT_105358 [Atractiella rhizophila]|nr:hypothetical protein BT69DRAFT_105358 [Atractiella rhizophila]